MPTGKRGRKKKTPSNPPKPLKPSERTGGSDSADQERIGKLANEAMSRGIREEREQHKKTGRELEKYKKGYEEKTRKMETLAYDKNGQMSVMTGLSRRYQT